jgi:phospholipid transport system substrate-binding protein
MVGAVALLALPAGLTRKARAQPGEQAVAFIKNTTDALVAIVNSESPLADKRLKLRAILNSVVDHDEIARYCLGRFWRIATPEQQKQYMALFYDLLAAQISGHLGEYKGVRVTMGLARKFEDTEIVITTVERPSNPATRVDWVVSTSSGTPQIVDLIAEGTSMRITQASDFTAFLAHHQYNVEDLIAAMRQKSAQNG